MNVVAATYMGAIVTSLFIQKAENQNVLMYGTITGEIGVFIPMSNLDLLVQLESFMMNDISPVCRIVDDYHSLYLPSSVCIL